MTLDPEESLLENQTAYYRARVPEYEDWFFRRGRYDRGPETTARWFAEAEHARQALLDFRPSGDVLELAAGTGIWTAELVPYARRLTVLDASPETLAINRAKVGTGRFLCHDVFSWTPDRAYDVVFFGFWLSHVPPGRFEAFWKLVRGCLKPEGRVFFVDSRREPTSTAEDHVLPEPDSIRSRRKLADGREFTIVKVYYEPKGLESQLLGLGWDVRVEQTDTYFIYGSGKRFDASSDA